METDATISSIKSSFLEECKEDDCGLWFLVNLIKEQYPEASRDFIKEVALHTLEELLKNDLVKAISIDYENASYFEWGLPTAEIISQISEKWTSRWKDMNGFDDIVWFVAA